MLGDLNQVADVKIWTGLLGVGGGKIWTKLLGWEGVKYDLHYCTTLFTVVYKDLTCNFAFI